jgi:hypothetical protein
MRRITLADYAASCSWAERVEHIAVVIPNMNVAPSIGLVIGSIPVTELAENGYETATCVVTGISRPYAEHCS